MAGEKKIRATTEESLHIPEEILENILVGFSVKSLLRLRCVSKSWLSLIDSKRFIETHFQYSTKNKDSDHHRVIMYTASVREPRQCSLRSLLGANVSPLCSPIWRDSIFHASYCKGLLCFSYLSGRFVLLNPSTRAFKELPQDPEMKNSLKPLIMGKIGLGWDESSGAYKVFVELNGVGRVYSSKKNSWKTVEELPDLPTTGDIDGKFVGGKLHWLCTNKESISSSDTISALDLKTELFGTIELPVDMKDGCFAELGDVGGCLCLSVCLGVVHFGDFGDPKKPLDVWVMKEYGVRESWEKLPTIHLNHLICSVRVIGEAANGEILIAYDTNLMVYCPRKGVIRHCRKIIGCYFEALYVESLISPVREISSI